MSSPPMDPSSTPPQPQQQQAAQQPLQQQQPAHQPPQQQTPSARPFYPPGPPPPPVYYNPNTNFQGGFVPQPPLPPQGAYYGGPPPPPPPYVFAQQGPIPPAYAPYMGPGVPHPAPLHMQMPPPVPSSPATPYQKRERKPLIIRRPDTKEEVILEKKETPATPAVVEVVAPAMEPAVQASPRLGPSPAALEMINAAKMAKAQPSPALKASAAASSTMPEVSLVDSAPAAASNASAAPAAAPPAQPSSVAPTPAVPAPAKATVWGSGSLPTSIKSLQPTPPPAPVPQQPAQQGKGGNKGKQQQQHDTPKVAKIDQVPRHKQQQQQQLPPVAPQSSAASLVAGNGAKPQQQQRVKEAAPEVAPALVKPTGVTAASLAAKPPQVKQTAAAAAPVVKQAPPPPEAKPVAVAAPPPVAAAPAAAAAPVVAAAVPSSTPPPPPQVVSPPPVVAAAATAPPPSVKAAAPSWDGKRLAAEAAVNNPPVAAKRASKIILSRDAIFDLRESPASLAPIADWPEDRFGFPEAVIRSRNFSAVKSAPPRVGAPPTVDRRNIPGAGPVSVFDEPLKLSENAWKRPSSENIDEMTQTLKTLRGILNKLTIENAPALTEQVLRLRVTSKAMLEEMIREIFSKALREPHFKSVYAQLCRDIHERSAGEWAFLGTVERDGTFFWTSALDGEDSSLNGPEGTYTPGAVGFATSQLALDAAKKLTGFKRMLLNNCQSEFESSSFEGVDEELRKANAEEESEEKSRTIAELEMKRKKIKSRVLGNIAFIGELFLKKMLSSRIINTCVLHLLGKDALSNPDEFINSKSLPDEDIECLHKLFTTVGKEMDAGDGRDIMNDYWAFFSKLEKSKTLSARYTFMILDLIELRQNRWVARRETETVSTKDDIRAKANDDQNRSRSSAGGGGRGGRDMGGPPRHSQQQQPSARFAQSATTTHSTVPVRAPVAPVAVKAAKAVTTEALSPEALKKKVENIFKEFAANNSVTDFVEEVRANATSTPDLCSAVAKTWFDSFLAKGDVKLFSLLQALMLEAKLLGADVVLAVLVENAIVLSDLAMDIPKAPQNLAQVVKHGLEAKLFTQSEVERAFANLVAEWKRLNAEDEYMVETSTASSDSFRKALTDAMGKDDLSQLLAL